MENIDSSSNTTFTELLDMALKDHQQKVAKINALCGSLIEAIAERNAIRTQEYVDNVVEDVVNNKVALLIDDFTNIERGYVLSVDHSNYPNLNKKYAHITVTTEQFNIIQQRVADGIIPRELFTVRTHD